MQEHQFTLRILSFLKYALKQQLEHQYTLRVCIERIIIKFYAVKCLRWRFEQ